MEIVTPLTRPLTRGRVLKHKINIKYFDYNNRPLTRGRVLKHEHH